MTCPHLWNLLPMCLCIVREEQVRKMFLQSINPDEIICHVWVDPTAITLPLPLCSWFSSSLLLYQLWHISNAAIGPFKSLNRTLTWQKQSLKSVLLSVKLAVWMIFGKSPAKKKKQVKIFICQYHLPVVNRVFHVQNCIEHQLLCHPLSASKDYPFVHIKGICNLKALKCSSLLSAKVGWIHRIFLVKLLIHDSFYLVCWCGFFFFLSSGQPLTKRNIYHELCDPGNSIAFHAWCSC